MDKLDIYKILELLPHRYPFVLIDRVIGYEKGSTLVGIKNVTFNEPFFTGHFPENPIMPGVLVLEALAQASGLLIFLTNVDVKAKDVYYFAGIDNVRFRKVVIPGDQLHLHVKVERNKLDVWKFITVAKVDDEIVCKANLTLVKQVK
jgi:3-hydroxyacyl-[acyl-carrier-protein] dehydratase